MSRSAIRAPSTGNRGGMVITYREFIQNVAPSENFRRMDFPIQPGLGLTFPFLSQLADSYEEYKIHACVFEFQTTCPDNVITAGASMGMGSVLMATNYNVNRRPFTDERSMENYEGCTSKKPSLSNIHVVQTKKGQTPTGALHWVRTGGTLANEDKRLYDVGTFSLATIGQPTGSTGVIGKLWVSYRVELFKPKYVGSQGSNLLQDHYVSNSNITGGYIDIGPFGTNPAAYPNNRFEPNGLKGAGTWISSSDPTIRGFDTINFAPEHQGMTFLIMYGIHGGGQQNLAGLFLPVAPTNVVVRNDFFSDYTSNILKTNQNAGGPANLLDAIIGCQAVQVASNDADGPWSIRFALTSNNIPVAPVFMDVYVIQMNGAVQPVSA